MTQVRNDVSTTPPLPGVTLVGQINDLAETLGTDFSGATDPAAMAWPYSKWADTANNQLKRRNAANSAWVVESILFQQSLPQYVTAPASNVGDIYVIGSGPMTWDTPSGAYKAVTPADRVHYVGEIFDFLGPVANIPSGAIQAPTATTNLSRATYAALFNAISVQVTGNTTSGSAVISGVSADISASAVAGTPVSGPGIPAGATLSSWTSNSITLSAAATATAVAVTIVIAPWGVGDGSTTFGCPYVPTDYATVHNPTASAKTTVGQVISHLHSVPGQVITSGGSGLATGSGVVAGSVNTASTGGPANLAAGSRVIKCLQVS